VRVHLVGEHPLELETADIRLERYGLGLDILCRRLVVLALRELQQLAGVGNSLGGLVDFVDGGGQTGPLLA
jgi:hypothetical protein